MGLKQSHVLLRPIAEAVEELKMKLTSWRSISRVECGATVY